MALLSPCAFTVKPEEVKPPKILMMSITNKNAIVFFIVFFLCKESPIALARP
jgi:hypothetical protein